MTVNKTKGRWEKVVWGLDVEDITNGRVPDRFQIALLSLFHWQRRLGVEGQVGKGERRTYAVWWDTARKTQIRLLFGNDTSRPFADSGTKRNCLGSIQ